MHPIVLFCKSYRKDMLRARRMADSVRRFNPEDIPLFMSVPRSDLTAFKDCFGDIPCRFFTDEDILETSQAANGPLPGLFPPHLLQQLIKLEFWRMDAGANYAWIDSDSYFIRPLTKADLMAEPAVPYTIQDIYDADAERRRMQHIPPKIREKRIGQICALIDRFRALFGNTGPYWAFGHSTPIIWSSRVLQHFNTDYLPGCGKRIYQILYEYPCETQLYGEYLHASRVIPIVGRPHMFKSFYHADDFQMSQEMGECEYSLSKIYWGICIQSNWARLPERKDPAARLRRHAGEYLRALGLMRFRRDPPPAKE